LDFDLKFVKLNGKDSKLIFEDNLIEIHTFPLKHRIPTNGFIIREKTKERRLISEAIKGSGLLIEHLPKLKRGENIVDEKGNEYDVEEFTLPPHPSYAYAFCSDTRFDESIVSNVLNVDVLYHEATFTEKDADRAKATFHSTAKQAASIAAKAEVKRLLMGHLSARYDTTDVHLEEAKTVFKNACVVEDGDVFRIDEK
jgi:ribonuclease Z